MGPVPLHLGLLVAEMWALSLVQPMPGSTVSEPIPDYDEIGCPGIDLNSLAGHTGHGVEGTGLCGQPRADSPVALFSWSIGDRQEVPPERAAFVDFSMRIGEWQGTPLPVEPQFISALRFDDYLLADFAAAGSSPITLYMAYYRSQRKGQSAHSPQSCIPGGGWEITIPHTLNLAAMARGPALPINRVLIQKDRQKQLVLYWFKQRDRFLSSEYLVKFYLFWDALMRQRSDGALIRLSAAVDPGRDEQDVEQRLLRFARNIQPQLNRYIPD
jgi:EpsI family protein